MEAPFAGRQRFVDRVQGVHDSWDEVRQVASLATGSDRESQFEAFRMLYRWCAAAAADLVGVYGDTLAVALTELPAADCPGLAFGLSMGDGHGLVASLEPVRGDASRWHIVVTLTAPGVANHVSVRPARNGPRWPRHHPEEVLLSLLASVERSRSSASPPWRAPAATLGNARPGRATATPGTHSRKCELQ